jgi:hypothetical protein
MVEFKMPYINLIEININMDNDCIFLKFNGLSQIVQVIFKLTFCGHSWWVLESAYSKFGGKT